MSVVNFTIPKTFEKRMKETIKTKGFASKAEFFRFAAIYVMDMADRPTGSEEDRFKELISSLEEEVATRFRGHQLPSLEHQLADL